MRGEKVKSRLKLESRHCEEQSDEAIHSFSPLRHGLLRFARNDGAGTGRSCQAFCNSGFAIPNLCWTSRPVSGCSFLNDGPTETAGKPSGWTECRILQCSNARKPAPANGQWHSAWLLCIGAADMQGSGPGCSRSAINTREETCVD